MHFKNTKVMQHLSVYLPIYLSICLSICLYVYVYITYIGRYPEILGRCCFKKLGKNNVSRSLLSQHLIGVPNATPGGVQRKIPKASTIVRHLGPQYS